MGTSERRQRHRASLRREILSAASQLFADEGYQRVTMRRIAERIEYSATAIYLHFRDKDELLRTVCEETFAELAGKLDRLEKAAAAPLAYLRQALRTYIDFGLTHPAEYRVTFMTPHPGQKSAWSEGSAGSRAYDALRSGVRACVERGDVQSPNADMTAQALWAAAHGATSLLIAMPDFPFVAKAALIDHTIDILLAGLKAPAATPRVQVGPRQARAEFLD